MKFKHSISIGTSLLLLTSSLYSDSWSSTQNEHGFVLKSADTTLYLGKDCDAISPQYGNGEWSWNSSDGINVILDKKDFSFNSGSLYDDGRCKKKSSQSSNTSFEKEDSSDDDIDATLVGAAIGIAAIGWLFGIGRDTSSSSSSSDYSSSSSSSINYVQIEAECIAGFSPCIEKNLQITGGSGKFEPSFNKAPTGTIYKDYQGNTAGTYNFSVEFDDNLCTGNFYISGEKEHYRIALGRDCHDNGSGEW